VIGIVELGGGWVQSDMAAYFKSINQPVPQITDVSVDGTKNSQQIPTTKPTWKSRWTSRSRLPGITPPRESPR